MSIRILIVDDEPNNLDVLRIFLGSLNYRVHEAVCGNDALAMIEQDSFDVILLDVMLPDISGFDICKQIKQENKVDTPIIFLSAYAQREAVQKGRDLGAFDYLTKPFDFDTLAEKLRNAVKN